MGKIDQVGPRSADGDYRLIIGPIPEIIGPILDIISLLPDILDSRPEILRSLSGHPALPFRHSRLFSKHLWDIIGPILDILDILRPRKTEYQTRHREELIEQNRAVRTAIAET